jgi:membrane fusion protein, multidrug efflux system
LTADKSAPPPAGLNPEQTPFLPAKGGRGGMRILVWILLLAVFAIAFIWVLGKHDASQTAPAGGRRGAVGGTIPITTATAQKGDIGVYLDEIGTVTPVYTDSITSQVNGQVVAVHFKEGQFVQKGDPLIDIDPNPYRATLTQAQGTLERDQNVLAQAQMDVERYRDAWSRKAIAKQILDDQEKLVLQDQGTVKNDEGTVQYDQIQLNYCHITAPISGRVGLRLVDPGNVVQSSGGLTLVVITQIKPITVVFTIPEDSLEQVVTGMRKKKLPADAFDRAALKKIATGTLQTLDNQIDTTTGTVKGRALFDNNDGSLFPNQFVNIRLQTDLLQGVTLIPSSAVQHNGQAAFVYLIQNNAAHMQSVKPGVTDAGVTQVEGINPGDVVANSSFDKLQDKATVSIANDAAQPDSHSSSSQSPPSNQPAKSHKQGSSAH